MMFGRESLEAIVGVVSAAVEAGHEDVFRLGDQVAGARAGAIGAVQGVASIEPGRYCRAARNQSVDHHGVRLVAWADLRTHSIYDASVVL